MGPFTAEQIIAIGGQRWTRGNVDRVYINESVWMRLIGLEISRYGSGNISSAALSGEEISNSHAKGLISAVGKVYWDSASGRVYVQTELPRYADEVTALILDAVDAAIEASGSLSDASDKASDDLCQDCRHEKDSMNSSTD